MTPLTCEPCPTGTYQNDLGSADCKLCDLSRSDVSAYCGKKCAADEFAPLGSNVCEKKQQCDPQKDKINEWTECDATGLQVKMEKYISPKVCSGNLNLNPNVKVPCTSCTKGQYLDNNKQCSICKKDDTQPGCLVCKNSEAPVHGLVYDTWGSWPSTVKSSCFEVNGTCRGWRLTPTGLSAGIGEVKHATFELDFMLSKAVPVTDRFTDVLQYELAFTMNCKQECLLRLKLQHKYYYEILKTWQGNVGQVKFQGSRYFYGSHFNMSLLFTKEMSILNSDESAESRLDGVTVHSLKLTGSNKLPIIECKDCPGGYKNGECIPCEKGKFKASDSSDVCVPCSANTEPKATASNFDTVEDSCMVCPPGTTSSEGSACRFNRNPVSPDGHRYNFKKIMQYPINISGELQQTDFGAWRNFYEVSFSPDSIIKCNDSTTADNYQSADTHACRRAVMLKNRHGYNNVSTILIEHFGGTQLYGEWRSEKKLFYENLMKTTGFPQPPTSDEFNLVYRHDKKTKNCPNGQQLIITLRCDNSTLEDLHSYEEVALTKSLGRMLSPPLCAAETCDGCTYHMVWLSVSACPICNTEDFREIRGDCILGKYNVHFMRKNVCYNTKGSSDAILPCPLISLAEAAGALMVVAVCLLISLFIVMFYTRNKRLHQRYARLQAEIENRQRTTSEVMAEDLASDIDSQPIPYDTTTFN